MKALMGLSYLHAGLSTVHASAPDHHAGPIGSKSKPWLCQSISQPDQPRVKIEVLYNLT
jgi:hypothetical protein